MMPPDKMFLSKILSAAEHPYLFGKGGRMKNNGTPQVILKSHNINIIIFFSVRA